MRRWRRWPPRGISTRTGTRHSGSAWTPFATCDISKRSGSPVPLPGRPGRRGMRSPLADDLHHVLLHTESLWDELRGQRLFITGGTGFVGCWLLETFLWANDELALNASVVVLTRNKTAFRKKAPHLADHSAL